MMSARAQKLNLIAFLITSFACYQGARRGFHWLGPAVLVTQWALFLPSTQQKGRRLVVALLTGLSGFALDTVLIVTGVYAVAETSRALLPAPLCPEWVLVLWLNFGFMLYLYRVILGKARWIAPVTGVVFSFVIMGNAARMGLLHFGEPVLRGYLIIAACWAILVPFLNAIANHIIGGAHVQSETENA